MVAVEVFFCTQIFVITNVMVLIIYPILETKDFADLKWNCQEEVSLVKEEKVEAKIVSIQRKY